MADSRFSVDLEELDNIVARLSALSGYIAEHLDEIDRRVAALIGAEWDGNASQAYSEAHRQWSTGARELVEGVRDISEAARAAHERYAAAIELNHKMLTGG